MTERELPGLTRYIKRLLAERGMDASKIEVELSSIMERVLLERFENLRQKPDPMSMLGWLAQYARQVIEQHFKSYESQPLGSQVQMVSP